jgi:hypothetical protein
MKFFFVLFLMKFLVVVGVKLKKFFIYEWDDEIVDRYPKAYSHHRLAFTPESGSFFGTGASKSLREGLHMTHQYSLFKTFYFRLLESSDRTFDQGNNSHVQSSSHNYTPSLIKTRLRFFSSPMTLVWIPVAGTIMEGS